MSESPLAVDHAARRRSDWTYRLGALGIGLTIIALWELLPAAGLVNPDRKSVV